MLNVLSLEETMGSKTSIKIVTDKKTIYDMIIHCKIDDVINNTLVVSVTSSDLLWHFWPSKSPAIQDQGWSRAGMVPSQYKRQVGLEIDNNQLVT